MKGMTMPNARENLVRLLEEAKNSREIFCTARLYCSELIADHLIANGVTVQEWISVKDDLPVLHIDDYEEPDGSRMQVEVSDFQWVFTATEYQTKARYESGPLFQGWVNERGSPVRNVTHWMPLPEPPKEV